jgi:osmotically-inducible protein OsmY
VAVTSTSDKALQEAVMRELEWDPSVDAAHIGVIARDGAVTLTGHVPSFAQKWAAVRAAERVFGVRAVADELKVKLPGESTRDDEEIAEQIARTLRWNTMVPQTVTAEVRRGLVTLRGEVEWSYQKDEAERAVRNITGVVGVNNLITVKPKTKPADVQRRIAEALSREADLDARRISVTTSDGTVELHGTVRSFSEKRLAEQAAASAPGVSKVENKLAVVP